MSVLTILVIRHAEKPGEAWPGPGLAEDGSVDDTSLVIRGWQRAGAWAVRFASNSDGDYPQPSIIYSADPRALTDPDASQRPFQTASPLAARLNVKRNVTYAVGQEAGLVAEVSQLTGVVLISWEHKAIARAILPLVVGPQVIPNLPTKWDGSRFDIVLRFDRADSGGPWSFRQLFPRLLAGDRDVPMP